MAVPRRLNPVFGLLAVILFPASAECGVLEDQTLEFVLTVPDSWSSDLEESSDSFLRMTLRSDDRGTVIFVFATKLDSATSLERFAVSPTPLARYSTTWDHSPARALDLCGA